MLSILSAPESLSNLSFLLCCFFLALARILLGRRPKLFTKSPLYQIPQVQRIHEFGYWMSIGFLILWSPTIVVAIIP